MPIARTSPPPPMPRSPISSSSSWQLDSPISPRRSRAKVASPSPRSGVAPPMPPMPSSPMLPTSPRVSSLGLSTSTAPCTPPPAPLRSSLSSSPRASTPPPSLRTRSRTQSKLLPALPLSVDTTLTPSQRHRRAPVSIEQTNSEDVQIIVSHEEPCSTPSPRRSRRASARPAATPSPTTSLKIQSPRPVLAAPPRPARRITADPSDLLPPLASFRASSPSGSSITTITGGDTTPRALVGPERTDSAPPPSASSLAAVTSGSTPMGRKRDSSQRRLSALRGLVANLDFTQHWSVSDKGAAPESELFWACGDPIEEEPADTSAMEPVRSLTETQAGSTRSLPVQSVTQDHGWPSPPPPTPPKDLQAGGPSHEVTPVQQVSIPRRPRSTPPRKPKLLSRVSSDAVSRTPDPPRASRSRMEDYGVASSGYNKSLEAPASPVVASGSTTTWRSSLSSEDVYQRVLKLHGSIEVKRQEVVWEMCETELAFVKSMRTVLRLFAIPLKTPQGKWIDGIPAPITDLFDTLECVAHAHGVIAAAERDMRRRSEVVDTAAFIAMFKSWVDRLEVHEDYLVRFEPVVQLVEENVRDPDSVFGEFVRMQMKDEVMGSMGLGSMLLKPVQRLTKYPLFLKRLLDVTPHSHSCNPELLSLLATTESIILRLQATKAREEDFAKLQALEQRLHGLPDDFVLAVRGRKLIGYGQVARVVPGKDLSPSLSVRARAGSIHSSRGSISSASSGAHSGSSSSPWDYSVFSPSTCRTSAFSVSSASSGYPPSRSNSLSQSQCSPSRPGVTRSPSSSSSVNSEHRPSTPSKSKRKDESLTMFVFDDLVVVAAVAHDGRSLFGGKKKGDKHPSLKVLSEAEGGIGKVLEAKDWSGWQGHNALFALTTVPLSYTARSPLASPITTAYTLPSASSPRRNLISSSTAAQLTTIPQYLATLSQATTATTSMLFSTDYRLDDPNGLESIGESGEWHGEAMGCAQ